jgi:hypothetical protein
MSREGCKILRVGVKTDAIVFYSQANLIISFMQPERHMFGPGMAGDIS